MQIKSQTLGNTENTTDAISSMQRQISIPELT